ncbi:NAD-dependent epimerase/dehydratase family protein [Pseudonocardia sediminis]|nr:NAD-dependent epimerase/dehydratase family protein [Pseudonocardia sediminis]
MVTGGAGFVGSTLVDMLVTRGDAVCVLDDLSRGSLSNLASALATGVSMVTADVRDADAVRRTASEFLPDVVFHLAAQIDVRASMADPAMDADVNIIGSLNVLTAAAEVGVPRIVLSSTGGAIYGDGAVIPTPESAIPAPASGYGLSKWTAERYGEWFAGTRALDVRVLRYGNVYGPRQDPDGDAGVIALYCDAALAGRRPIVFGDGLQTRDFVYVDDIAAANIAAATTDGVGHRVFNVGSGTEISVLELARAVGDSVGVPPERWRIDHRPPRAGEVRRSCLDVSRARHELRLGPGVPLEPGIRRTVAWIRSRSRDEARGDHGDALV